jgi:preprotein translocase subunit Sss1
MHFGSSSDQAQPSLLGTILGIIGIIGFLLLLLGEVIK